MSTTRRRFGWTCIHEVTRRGERTYHYWRAYKRVGGRVRAIYIGRDWNRETLAKFKEKVGRIEKQVRVKAKLTENH